MDELLDELHLERSDKSVPVRQHGVFLCVLLDSHSGRLLLTEPKWEKLLTDLWLVLTWDEVTPRMASIGPPRSEASSKVTQSAYR